MNDLIFIKNLLILCCYNGAALKFGQLITSEINEKGNKLISKVVSERIFYDDSIKASLSIVMIFFMRIL